MLIGRPVGDSAGGNRAFFFMKDAFLGNDATNPSTKLTVAKAGKLTVTLSYGVYASGDAGRGAERPQEGALPPRGHAHPRAGHDPARQRPLPAPAVDWSSPRGGPRMEPSYASGTSSTPLLGDTIGDNLDRTIARHPDREALVSVHQDLRYTYAQFGEAVDRVRARVHRGGDRARGPRRHLEPQLRRVGARPVRDGQGRDHPGQHQPGLPDVGARVRAAPVGLPDAGRRDRVQDERLRADGRRRARQPDRARAGRVHRPRLGGVHRRRRAGRRRGAAARARPRPSSTTRSTSSTRAAPRASPRARRSATTTSSTTATSSAAAAATPSRTASASRCPTTTASAWSWATWPARRTAPAW